MDEKVIVEWYFNFMSDIDDDTDKMVDNYEIKIDLWNIDIQKDMTIPNESDIWYREMMWNVNEKKLGDLWVDRGNTPYNGMVYGYFDDIPIFVNTYLLIVLIPYPLFSFF